VPRKNPIGKIKDAATGAAVTVAATVSETVKDPLGTGQKVVGTAVGQAVAVAGRVGTRLPGRRRAAAPKVEARPVAEPQAEPRKDQGDPVKKAAAKKAPVKKAPSAKAAVTAPAKAAKKAPPKKTAKKAAKKTAPARTAGTAVATRPTSSTSARKSAAPRRAAKTLVVKEGEEAWTKAEIKEVLSELHQDRDRVVRTLSGQEAELDKLMRDAGDGAGHDQADMGATSFERDQEIIVVQNEREKLAQIDRALARIADGTYGICESCGNPIGKMRAMAFPRATLCMTCKQREERR
jgi:RNA polymerase-binding protein DksA